MIFAGESTINKFTDGNRIMNIVQNDYQWDLRCTGFPIDLIGQIRKIKLQVLVRKQGKGQSVTQVHERKLKKENSMKHHLLLPCMTGGAC